MNKKLLTIALLMVFAIVSCKKSTKQDTPVPVTATNQIKAPVNFSWQNSRNINFTVNLTDTRYPGLIDLICIYNADPAAGGNLLAKGSATTTVAFKSKIYISYEITQVYIVKTAPDNSKTTLVVPVGTADINTSIGL